MLPVEVAHEARGLVLLALRRVEDAGPAATHPGVSAHLRAARVQLDAACQLLTHSGLDAAA